MEISNYWQQVEELFHAALQLPPGARDRFLSEACGSQEALRAEVAALLAAHETPDGQPLDAAIQAVAGQFLTATGGTSLEGLLIRQYEIRARLGHGGMGEVYLAYDNQLCRQVALKRLRVPLAALPHAKQRFRREAQAAAQLDHPNVCTIHEVLEVDAECFIVMQYIAGETLAARLQHAPLALEQALDCAIQIAAALGAAQAAGIIHRDLKPHNIMLSAQGQVKVLDFGIAKFARPAGAGLATPALTTNPALILGTPNYMSPEQARGETVDARSDLFSLGVVLYEMLTGQPPFAAPAASEVLANVLKTEPAPLRTLLPAASPALEAVLQKALAKPVEQRYQTAQALMDDLRQVQQIPVEARPSRLNGAWRGGRAGGVAALVLLLLTVSWLAWRRPAFEQSAQLDSLAVLPFRQTGGDEQSAYLAAGLTEELINDLTKVTALRIVPRSVVFEYQDKAFDLRQVGERLQVRTLLTGRLTVHNGQLELQAELVEAARQAQLWGQRFSRPVSELQLLRQDVTTALLANLRPVQQSALPQQHPTSPAAYEAYLKGLYALRQRLRGEAGTRSTRTVNLLESALKLDQHYAPAWAALAAAYAALTHDGVLPSAEGASKAKDAALKALSLDNSLPEAHLALADTYFFSEWNYAEAEREYKRYIELNPHDAQPWRSYAQFLSYQRRFPEAQQALTQGRQLEPYSYANEVALAHLLSRERRYEHLIEHCLEAIKLYPRQLGLKIDLASAYLAQGQFDLALKLRAEVTESRPTPSSIFRLAIFHAAAGDRERAFELLARYQARRAAEGSVSHRHAYGMARLHAVLGEKEASLQYLEKAYQQKVVALVALATDSAFDKLRDEPRFQEMLRRLGF
jgi:serine/threonine protein kinase